jgi:hypothetical protein
MPVNQTDPRLEDDEEPSPTIASQSEAEDGDGGASDAVEPETP